MIFGALQCFAVEIGELAPIPGNYLARARFWIAGGPVGEFDQDCVLGGLVLCLEEFATAAGQRSADRFRQADDAYVLKTVASMLGGHHPLPDTLSYADLNALTSNFRPYALCPYGPEPFDGWLITAVDHPAYTRVSWRNHTGELGGVDLPPGEIEAVLREAVTWANQLPISPRGGGQ